MNINIYQKYKVRITNDSTRLSEENETIYDNIFVDEKYENEIIIDGGKLMDQIAELLKDNYISEFVIVGKELHFKLFNYNNGETESICYYIEEIENGLTE